MFLISAVQFSLLHSGFFHMITYEVITMQTYQRARKKQKKKKGNFFFCLRLFICVFIICGAIVLKQTEAPALKKISEVIKEEFEIDKAIEVVSGKIKGDDSTVEVFEEKKEAEKENETHENSFENFYIGDIQQSIAEEKEKIKEEEKQLNLEALSFRMSAEELADDTAAEPFRIPPPSYCSYQKETINFKFKAPLDGVVTSRFGYRDHPVIEDASFHTGLDIAAKKGKSIGAFADGKVVEAGKNATYGNYLLIEHSGGFKSFYGHNSKLCVKKGQKVTLGQKIAEVGSTGMSTGPHLHFEIRKGNLRLDPSLYILSERV